MEILLVLFGCFHLVSKNSIVIKMEKVQKISWSDRLKRIAELIEKVLNLEKQKLCSEIMRLEKLNGMGKT